MRADLLKKAILQMAVQGKLVPQDPNDEPASELLKRIEDEKKRLIKEKKIKKEKTKTFIFRRGASFYENIDGTERCIDEEIPFEIPESWEWVRLGNIFHVEMGQSPDGDTVSENEKGIEFHQGKVFFGNKYIQKSNQTTSAPTKIANENSVLLCVRAPVGKVNITQRRICIGRGLCAISSICCITCDFIYRFLEAYESIFVKQATGTTFIAITGEAVKKQLFPLPPLAEQKRIVEKIEELLPHVDDYGEAERKLSEIQETFPERLKKSILQQAVTGRLVPQDPNDEPASELLKHIEAEKKRLIKEKKIKKEKTKSFIFKRGASFYENTDGTERCIDEEIPFEIPESWEWVRLGNVVYNRGQITPNEKFSYIDIGSIDNSAQKLSDDEKIIAPEKAPSRARKIVDLGDILYSTVRPYLHNMCIVDRTFTYKPIASTGFAVMTCYSGLYNRFLFRYLMSPHFDAYANDTENSKGVAYPAINDSKLYTALIPLPPLAEQKRIVEKIEALLPLCEKMKQ